MAKRAAKSKVVKVRCLFHTRYIYPFDDGSTVSAEPGEIVTGTEKKMRVLLSLVNAGQKIFEEVKE